MGATTAASTVRWRARARRSSSTVDPDALRPIGSAPSGFELRATTNTARRLLGGVEHRRQGVEAE